MKKQLLPVTSFIAIFFLFVSGCKSDPPPAPKTKTQLISQSPWVFQSAFAGSTDISAYPQIACFKDNIITFAAAGTFNVNEAANVCSPSTAGNFTWSFQTNETEILLSAPLFPNGSNTFTLVSLTETNLVVSQAYNLPPVTPITVTFKH
jgi:hypothetical protein